MNTVMTPVQELEFLRRENERLKQAQTSKISLKVSAKGAVSAYGLGRFPVTLYSSQWERLLGMKDQISTFIDNHRAELAVKA